MRSPVADAGSSNVRPAGRAVETRAVSTPGSTASASRVQRQPGEVAAPPARLRQRCRGHAEEREGRRGGDIAREPQDGRRRGPVPAVENRDELREVLVGDVRGRDGEGGLVLLAADQRRAICEGEEGEAQARNQERRRHRRAARVPGQREGGQPERERPAAADAADPAERRHEQADGRHRCGEGDESGNEEHERLRAAAGRERRGIDRAPRGPDDDDRNRGKPRDVERRQGQPAGLQRGRAHREVEQQRRGGGGARGGEQPAAREQGMLDDRPGGRARPGRRRRGDGPADQPADDRAAERDRTGLAERAQLDLPAARTGPQQAPSSARHLPPQRGRGKNRECEQQRARLAAEQQETPRRDARGRDRRGQLVRRRRHLEPVGAGRQLGPEIRDAVGVRSHRPGVDVARLDRDEPRVGAEERRQLRGAREAVDTVREQHGGGLRRVVPQRPGDERRRLRLDEGREGRVGVEPGPADLDQAERRLRRDRPRAGDPQHLAVRRHAAARQAAGEEVDVAAEPVRGPQIDEAAVDLRLAIEHRPRGLAARTRDERGRDGSVERAPRPPEGTEPRHLERPVGRRKGSRRLGHRPVLDDEPPAEHRCDRR